MEVFEKEFYCTKVSFSSSLYPFPFQLRQHLQPLDGVLHVSLPLLSNDLQPRRWGAEVCWRSLPRSTSNTMLTPFSNLLNGLCHWKYRRDRGMKYETRGKARKVGFDRFDLKTCEMHVPVKVCLCVVNKDNNILSCKLLTCRDDDLKSKSNLGFCFFSLEIKCKAWIQEI